MKLNKPGMSPGHFGEFSPMSNKLFNDRRKLAKIANVLKTSEHCWSFSREKKVEVTRQPVKHLCC